jgi:hypothetical protein
MQNNPKWWVIAETAIDAREPIGIILPSNLAAHGLRDELLIEFGWDEFNSLVRVRSFREARRSDETFERVQLLGNWRDGQRPLLFGLLARSVTVLGYEYEACVLDKRLSATQADIDVTVAAANRTFLANILGPRVVEPSENPNPSIQWNTEDIRAARTGTTLLWRRIAQDMARQGVSSAQEYETFTNEGAYSNRDADDDAFIAAAADQVALRQIDVPIGEIGEADEMVGTVTLTFADGTTFMTRVDRELLVLPKKKASTEQRFASSIEPGDRVLVFTEGAYHGVFETTLSRTHHLLLADLRVIERWRDVLLTLRARFPPDEYGQGARYCAALEALHCRRDQTTMRSWLYGSTLAPSEIEDIACVLKLAGLGESAGHWAVLIAQEIGHVRTFNRKIGRRIVQRMLNHGTGAPPGDRIDEEIDELLESAELREVIHVGNVEQRPKSQLARSYQEEEEI